MSAATESYLSIRGAQKIYNPGPKQVEAVSSVTVDIPAGQFVSILGPSGCGKSTLLMMVAGLENVTAGRIVVSNAEVAGPRDDVGIIFQDPTLLPWKSALDNVLFPVRVRDGLVKHQRERATDLLEMVGLGDFIDKRPAELSGGMKQRVAICRALITDPDILLMDEPFSALDAITRDEMNVALAEIWDRCNNKTALFVTHSIREAVFLSDRILVMAGRPSRIVRDVTVPFDRPRSLSIGETPEFNRLCADLRAEIENAYGEKLGRTGTGGERVLKVARSR